MGIFTRTRDIVNANINSMLDKAEDPEKLVSMIVREMEDTLIELKASCASAMATKRRIERDLENAEACATGWAGKARSAVDKGRDDLARRALLEKRRYSADVEGLGRELDKCGDVIQQCRDDIGKLEDKLVAATEKRRVLVQRHIQAQNRLRTESNIRRLDTADTFARFDVFEHHVERMEADAHLVNYGRKPTLQEEINGLGGDDEIERELRELKQSAHSQ